MNKIGYNLLCDQEFATGAMELESECHSAKLALVVTPNLVILLILGYCTPTRHYILNIVLFQTLTNSSFM